jgi:hypothetical protein
MLQGVKLHSKGRYYTGRNAQVDGDMFSFRGEGGSVGVVKILEPMSPLLNYYEYQIVCRGRKCAIGIGVGEQGYPLDRMPGWNRNGIGYHADDGRLFFQDGFGRAFAATCTEGDHMGCGIDYEDDTEEGYRSVFFTKNGKQIGEKVKMRRPLFGFYPIIGMHSMGEKVRYLGHWRRQCDGVQEPMEQDTSPSTYWLRSNAIRFLSDGLTLEYVGNGLDKQDVGIAQARLRLDQTNHYFEMEIVSCGKEGWLALGLGKSTYPLHRHPGWNKGSVGYHADNGQLYKESGVGEEFGPQCTTGDIMGCGILFPAGSSETEDPDGGASQQDSESEFECDSEHEIMYGFEEDEELEDDFSYDSDDDFPELFERNLRQRWLMRERERREPRKTSQNSDTSAHRTVTVYFTKNGERVGETVCSVPRGGFYPLVAMLSQGERCRVDFHPLSG